MNTERVKTSVRLDADVVEIISSYAKAHTRGDKTLALNELIRISSNHLATQETPTSPQIIQRLDRMEQELQELKQRFDSTEPPIATQELPEAAIAPNELPFASLVLRLTEGHIRLDGAKTAKGKTNAASNLPLVLRSQKVNKLAAWTSARDPQGLSWLPTDDTRETWVAT